MMGYLCKKSVYEQIPYPHDREEYYYCIQHSGASLTRKSANQLKKITDKETTVDPICCLAVMKLARSVFAHKKAVFLAALFSTRIAPSI